MALRMLHSQACWTCMPVRHLESKWMGSGFNHEARLFSHSRHACKQGMEILGALHDDHGVIPQERDAHAPDGIS
jgi:hypothetical protein